MLRAILSDLHGNLEALEAVLVDLDRRMVTSLACLGDFVGYGASPNECIDRLGPRLEVAVIGNHDLAACGGLQLGTFQSDAAIAAQWTGRHLRPESRSYLMSLPETVRWHGLRLVHATPSSPRAWHYVLSIADATEEMMAFDERTCVVGHSHVPGAFVGDGDVVRYRRDALLTIENEHRYLVNAGSVGQPRDGDPRAAYLLVDEDAKTLEHVRVEYDVETAMEKIRAAGLPSFLAERLRWGE